MTKVFIAIGVFVVLIGIVLIVNIITGENPAGEARARVSVNGREYLAEVADTPDKKARGLSGRESLAVNRAMYFPFDRPGIYPFWMQGMKFSIDIIWIRGGTIIGIVEGAKPGGFPPAMFYPPSDIDAVLEVATGPATRGEIKVGDTVRVESIN